MKFCKFSNKINFLQRGFTLLELLVVITIATIITTALVVQHNKWNDQLVVSTQAYELALMIRQAQVYGLGVRVDNSISGDKFSIGYGIYFDTNDTRYIFFSDRNLNQKYDSGEAIETKTLLRGVRIRDVCGSTRCIFTGGGSLRRASIAFSRPYPSANISLLNVGGNSVDTPPITITLRSPGNVTKVVRVESNGLVSIQ